MMINVGVFNAIMDTLMFHYHISVFKRFKAIFWNPEISWKNKYKDDLKTPKFLFSTTMLVWVTDAWHLFKTLYKNSFRINLILVPLLGGQYGLIKTMCIVLIGVILEIISFNLSFKLFKCVKN